MYRECLTGETVSLFPTASAERYISSQTYGLKTATREVFSDGFRNGRLLCHAQDAGHIDGASASRQERESMSRELMARCKIIPIVDPSYRCMTPNWHVVWQMREKRKHVDAWQERCSQRWSGCKT